MRTKASVLGEDICEGHPTRGIDKEDVIVSDRITTNTQLSPETQG